MLPVVDPVSRCARKDRGQAAQPVAALDAGRDPGAPVLGAAEGGGQAGQAAADHLHDRRRRSIEAGSSRHASRAKAPAATVAFFRQEQGHSAPQYRARIPLDAGQEYSPVDAGHGGCAGPGAPIQ